MVIMVLANCKAGKNILLICLCAVIFLCFNILTYEYAVKVRGEKWAKNKLTLIIDVQFNLDYTGGWLHT